jgi:hypothetical protein
MHQQKCVAAPATRVHYDSSGILGLIWDFGAATTDIAHPGKSPGMRG